MELALNMNEYAFAPLTFDELMEIDGGISWNDAGLYAAGAAGGLIGAKIGQAWGPVGIAVGTILGGVIGIIIYTLWD